MAFPTLTLSGKLEHALSSGHPWIYRDHLPENDLVTGEWVLVQSGRARVFGLYAVVWAGRTKLEVDCRTGQHSARVAQDGF
jgi:PUA-like domain